MRLDLDLEAGVVEGPEIVGVSPIEIASVELVAAYEQGEDGEPWGPPLGVRAIVRDADGDLLRAPGVQWGLSGDAELFGWGDVAVLGTECTEPETGSGSQFATVNATIAGHSETIELRWSTVPCEVPPEDPFNPDEPLFDLSLCVCTSDGSRPTAPGVVLTLVVLLSLRPRPRRGRLRAAAGRGRLPRSGGRRA
jgi:hypothetical protein